MRLTFSSLFIFAIAALVSADGVSFNPPSDTLKPIPITSTTNSVRPIVGRMTNARRLAMGLLPLKPKASRHGTRAASAPRSNPSMSPPVPTGCNILVKSATETFGYIKPQWNGFGEYGVFQADQAGALEVTFNASPDVASAELDFTVINTPSTTYPYFGAISGFASQSNDFGPGSYNYAYLGGTTQTPSGSPPSDTGDNSFTAATGIPETIESAIWTYDPTTQAITAQWINTDGSSPATHIIYANDTNQALTITGDVATLQATFGAPYPEVTFTCVPPVSSQTPA
ncbi:hypothetical protein M407DRAFT_245478 [Tulasnella calospora MUT 4182]|uniref:Glycoside hydrolase family 16 protein n=1 Tax=Tulasnella calospora MUT 4182 TaxID=1051891 RepID=A0A0C3QAY2_9AGAM|nr:hypothetical protein M407DRAFT_245478 [Tulasnella calospora MUT 4182]